MRLARRKRKSQLFVAQLYGITDEELNEIKKCLRILKEGEIEEREVEEER